MIVNAKKEDERKKKMQIRELWNKHKGEILYVVGTGPSMRVFPVKFLSGKITIALNQGWKFFNPTYCMTMHPELVDFSAKCDWIVKGRKNRDVFGNQVPMFDLEDSRCYVYLTRAADKRTDAFETCGECSVYQGGGIHSSAIHTAYRMGASTVFLIGIDCCSLDGEFHGHAQHVRWAGKKPEDAYAEYRHHTRIVREELRKRGVPVLTLTPFVGCGHAEEDYTYLKQRLGLEHLPVPEDVSGRRP